METMTTETDMLEAPASSGDGTGDATRPGAVRLNIGAGGTEIPGYTPFDIKDGFDASQPLPFEDGSVDEIYASHVLEHIPYTQTVPVLREWARVLKPNGIMRIAVPDMDKLCRERTIENRWLVDRVIYGGRTDQHDVHVAGFDADTLANAMHAAGIGHVQPFEPFAEDCSRHQFSLNLEGRKRWWPRLEKPTIALVMSQPRLCFTDHATRLIDLAHALPFGRVLYGGAFWDRDITLGTKKAIDTMNPDFLLYSDYDSTFTTDDVLKLIDTLQSCPEAAAVTCVQMNRNKDYPLVFDPKRDYSGPMTRVDFGHFGLTIIRADVFKELPQPWFWSMPGRDPEGHVTDWEGAFQSDADITFWRSLHDYGFPVIQRNDVIIGHMILSVKWPTNLGKGFMLQPIESYNKVGKPNGVVLDQEVYLAKLKQDYEAELAAKQKEPK